jgi:hypothetical protein
MTRRLLVVLLPIVTPSRRRASRCGAGLSEARGDRKKIRLPETIQVEIRGKVIMREIRLRDSGVFQLFTVTLISFGMLSLLASCGSTRTSKVYKASDYSGGPLNKIMIVGIAENQENRKRFEELLAEKFNGVGVDADPISQTIPLGKTLNKEVIKGEAERLGMEAVMVTRLKGIEEKSVYTAPGNPQHYNHFDHYFPVVYQDVHRSKFYSQYENVRLENNLYDTRTAKLIWSAESETVNRDSIATLVDSLFDEIVKELKKTGLIP